MELIVESDVQLLCAFWTSVENTASYNVTIYKVLDKFSEIIDEYSPLLDIRQSIDHAAQFQTPRNYNPSRSKLPPFLDYCNEVNKNWRILSVVVERDSCNYSHRLTPGNYMVEVSAFDRQNQLIEKSDLIRAVLLKYRR